MEHRKTRQSEFLPRRALFLNRKDDDEVSQRELEGYESSWAAQLDAIRSRGKHAQDVPIDKDQQSVDAWRLGISESTRQAIEAKHPGQSAGEAILGFAVQQDIREQVAEELKRKKRQRRWWKRNPNAPRPTFTGIINDIRSGKLWASITMSVRGLFDEQYDATGREMQEQFGSGKTVNEWQEHVAKEIWDGMPYAHDAITQFLTRHGVPKEDDTYPSRVGQLARAKAHLVKKLKMELMKNNMLTPDSGYKGPYFPPGQTVLPEKLFDRFMELRNTVETQHERRFSNTVGEPQRLQKFLNDIRELDKDAQKKDTKKQKVDATQKLLKEREENSFSSESLYDFITKKILLGHQLLNLKSNSKAMSLVDHLMELFDEYGGGQQGRKMLLEKLKAFKEEAIPRTEEVLQEGQELSEDGRKLNSLKEKLSLLQKLHKDLAQQYDEAWGLGGRIHSLQQAIDNSSTQGGGNRNYDPNREYKMSHKAATEEKSKLMSKISGMERDYLAYRKQVEGLLGEKNEHAKLLEEKCPQLKNFLQGFKDSDSDSNIDIPKKASSEKQLFGNMSDKDKADNKLMPHGDSSQRGEFVTFISSFNSDQLSDMEYEVKTHYYKIFKPTQKLTAQQFDELLEKWLLMQEYPDVPEDVIGGWAGAKLNARQAIMRDDRQMHRDVNKEIGQHLAATPWQRLKKRFRKRFSPERMMPADYIMRMASLDTKHKDLAPLGELPPNFTFVQLQKQCETVSSDALKVYEMKLKKILEQPQDEDARFNIEIYDKDALTIDRLVRYLKEIQNHRIGREIRMETEKRIHEQVAQGKEVSFNEVFLAVQEEKRVAYEERDMQLAEETFKKGSFWNRLLSKLGIQQTMNSKINDVREQLKGKSKEEQRSIINAENLGAALSVVGTGYALNEQFKSIGPGLRKVGGKTAGALRSVGGGGRKVLNTLVGKPVKFVWNKAAVPSAKFVALPFLLAGSLLALPTGKTKEYASRSWNWARGKNQKK